MKITATELVNKALEYEGLTEYPPNSNNVIFNTIYYKREVHDRDRGPDAFYPWCVTFCVSLFEMLGAPEMIPRTASSSYLINHTKGYGTLITKPEELVKGDIAVLDFPETKVRTDHTVIVISNDKNKRLIHTIEGNTSENGSQTNGGAVLRKTRSYSLFVAAFRPDYKAEDEDMDISRLTDQQIDELWKRIIARTSLKQTSDYAMEASRKGVKKGIFSDGDQDGLVDNPLAPVLRQDLAVVLNRLELLDK